MRRMAMNDRPGPDHHREGSRSDFPSLSLMPHALPRAVRLLLPIALLATVNTATTPPALCAATETTAAGSGAWCSCGGTASIGRAMESATLVAIAVLDSTVPGADNPAAETWPLRIERAWKWPGGGSVPPRRVVVVQGPIRTACAITILPGQRQLVVALVRSDDGALILGHKCATPWGAVDTLGTTAAHIRQFGGASVLRLAAQSQARMLDSLRAYGPGTEPVP